MNKTILVVEDDPDVKTFFCALLEESGFKALHAVDGVEALALARRHRPDLVTLDISLPRQSGVRTYRELKSDPDLRAIPVLMVTGVPRAFRGFISSRRQVPAPEGYLDKPVSAEEYLAEVKRLLGCEDPRTTSN